MLVAVSGTIGAGKSTFCAHLGSHLGFGIVPEPVSDNPYLSDFYENPARWAFAAQVFMVTHRFRRYLDVSTAKGGFLLDRCLFEDYVFAEVCKDMGYLTLREWDTYCALQESFLEVVPPPEAIVYLRVSPETAARRIASRARGFEQSGVTIDYLRRLHQSYEGWVERMQEVTTVLAVDWSEFGDVAEVAKALPEGCRQFHI